MSLVKLITWEDSADAMRWSTLARLVGAIGLKLQNKTKNNVYLTFTKFEKFYINIIQTLQTIIKTSLK